MKIILTVFVTMAVISCFAQKDIPDAVHQGFKKQFANVTVKKWEKEDGNYEATFLKEGKRMSASFNAKGAWLETETDIAVKSLPAGIALYVKQHYNEPIKEAAALKTPTGDMYEAEVKGKDILFDMNGNFLKEEKD